MLKRIISSANNKLTLPKHDWLDLEKIAEVEISSEDRDYPIENALLEAGAAGWRAAEPGVQIIRLLFPNPQSLSRIWLNFVEASIERTQEYTVRYSTDQGQSYQEIIRQQWNFSPSGSTSEIQDFSIKLTDVSTLEISINPDISHANKFATLASLRLA